MNLLSALIWFSAISFFYFGISCFYSKFIIAEFKRYGLPKYRKVTGWLQLLGATGLVVGYFYSYTLILLASFGLFLLMLSGFVVRLKIKDNFIKSSPSFFFAMLNLIIAFKVLTTQFI